MSDDASYQASVISALSGTPETPLVAPNSAASAVSTPETPPSALEVGAPPPKVEVKAETPKKTLQQIAAERAAERMEREGLKPLQTLANKLGPQGMHELVNAMQSNDTETMLRVMGVSPTELRFQRERAEAEQKQEVPADPRYEALEKKLAALESERNNEKLTTGRRSTLDATAKIAQDPEFEYISDDTDAHDQALKMVEDYILTHKEWPAETREESIRLGLREVNELYKKQAEKFAKLQSKLTAGKKPATTVPESPVYPTRAVSDVGKTLNNSSMPAISQTSPHLRSDEDYQKAVLAAITKAP